MLHSPRWKHLAMFQLIAICQSVQMYTYIKKNIVHPPPPSKDPTWNAWREGRLSRRQQGQPRRPKLTVTVMHAGNSTARRRRRRITPGLGRSEDVGYLRHATLADAVVCRQITHRRLDRRGDSRRRNRDRGRRDRTRSPATRQGRQRLRILTRPFAQRRRYGRD